MDVSHITALLSNLGKNQVTIPIITNHFEEMSVDEHYKLLFPKNDFDNLDDMLSDYRKSKPNNDRRVNTVNSQNVRKDATKASTSNNVSKKTTPKTGEESKNAKINHNIIFVLASIRDNLLSLETNIEKIKDVSRVFIKDVKEFVSNSIMKKLNIEKHTKASIIDQLDIISNKDLTSDKLSSEQIDLIVKIVCRYLRRSIIIFDNDKNLISYEFDDNENDDTSDINTVIIVHDIKKEHYFIEDIVPREVFQLQFYEINIKKLKLQENYEENLKLTSVKDLRHTAKNIGIDVFDTHTGKLYSKSDLKLLIEAKIRATL
jgi:hypothetical protein